MRPVAKWRIGHVYTTKKDGTVTITELYSPYGDAYDHLVNNIGLYCNYCEAPGSYFEIEHVVPKSQILSNRHDTGSLTEESWENLLLACAHCNSGTGCKGQKIVDLENILLPHRNNTYEILDYKEGGGVMLKEDLSPTARLKAQALIDLFSLDRNPDTAGVKRDHRLFLRSQVWDLAEATKAMYEKNRVDEMIAYIIITAKPCGFFSVWHTVFQDHPEVQTALRAAFPGTNEDYF